MKTVCDCGEEQFSPYCRTYLKEHGRCCECNYRSWNRGELTAEELGKRERIALNKMEVCDDM